MKQPIGFVPSYTKQIIQPMSKATPTSQSKQTDIVVIPAGPVLPTTSEEETDE